MLFNLLLLQLLLLLQPFYGS